MIYSAEFSEVALQKNEFIKPLLPKEEGTLDLSEFNVNIMTWKNGAHQRYPYDPGIQKWPFFFSRAQNFLFASMELMI